MCDSLLRGQSCHWDGGDTAVSDPCVGRGGSHRCRMMSSSSPSSRCPLGWKSNAAGTEGAFLAVGTPPPLLLSTPTPCSPSLHPHPQLAPTWLLPHHLQHAGLALITNRLQEDREGGVSQEVCSIPHPPVLPCSPLQGGCCWAAAVHAGRSAHPTPPPLPAVPSAAAAPPGPAPAALCIRGPAGWGTRGPRGTATSLPQQCEAGDGGGGGATHPPGGLTACSLSLAWAVCGGRAGEMGEPWGGTE